MAYAKQTKLTYFDAQDGTVKTATLVDYQDGNHWIGVSAHGGLCHTSGLLTMADFHALSALFHQSLVPAPGSAKDGPPSDS
jgi:hypothetical protein